MGDISIKGHGCERRGSKGRTRHNKGGRVGLKFGGGRTNLLEELGRVEAEPSNRNRRADIVRTHSKVKTIDKINAAEKKIKEGTKELKHLRQTGWTKRIGKGRKKQYFPKADNENF